MAAVRLTCTKELKCIYILYKYSENNNNSNNNNNNNNNNNKDVFSKDGFKRLWKSKKEEREGEKRMYGYFVRKMAESTNAMKT